MLAWLGGAVLALGLLAPAARAAEDDERHVRAVAEAHYAELVAAGRTPEWSNTVRAMVVPASAVVRFYTDAGFRVLARRAVVGQQVYLQAEAPACNLSSGIDTVTLRLQSDATSRSQTVQAIETAAGSGVFRTGPETLSLASAADGLTQADDKVWVILDGCGVQARAPLPIEPGGVVFDSTSHAPLAGVRVTLIDIDGVSNGGRAGAPALMLSDDSTGQVPASAVTRADGRYSFSHVVPGRYRLEVVLDGYLFPSKVAAERMAAGHKLQEQVSYGEPFDIAADGAIPAVDLPADMLPRALMVQVSVSRPTAEPAESVVYTAIVRNAGEAALGGVSLSGRLPAGFRYVPGSARGGDGKPVADPAGGRGPSLRFAIGGLAGGDTRTFTYRALVGAEAPEGDARHPVQARAERPEPIGSNLAHALVSVQPGVLTDKAMVTGSVYADCNANGLPDAGEPGVPGVRVVMEDGSFAVTDGRGRYSLYGLRPRTHVLKVDAASLPPGATLVATSARHAGDAGSRFIDPVAAELQRADFAVRGCDAALRTVLAERAARLRTDRELDASLKTTLAPDGQPRALSDVRALEAAGLVGPQGVQPAAVAASAVPAARKLAEADTAQAEAPIADDVDTLQVLAERLDPTLDFIDVQDGQRVRGQALLLRVKGRDGARIALAVNGQPVGEDRIGQRVRHDGRQIELREYVGVPMRAGVNTLELTEADGFGNVRARRSVTLRAPGAPAVLRLVVPEAPLRADAETVTPIGVELLDDEGLRVAGRRPVTLQADRGQWEALDLDALTPGVQTFIEDGHAVIGLRAPADPGSAVLSVVAGPAQAQARLRYEPAMRPLLAAGLVEGTLDLRRLGGKAVQPADGDDFAKTLQAQAAGEATGARAALFLKGKVRGDALLTVAYDSDKDTRDRLFRDIQPDAFYPVYGDASVKGFDAQSTGKLYVKVERGASFVLYGDFTTQAAAQASRQLGAYQRSLNGAKVHHEEGPLKVTAFASRDASRQQIMELRGNGTSGPYALGLAGARVNSERVEILVRDRNQPAVVLRSTLQQRFTDYEFDSFTGSLLMRAPVPSFDADLNPVSLRITVEVEQGGPAFWVAGAEAELAIGERLSVGGSLVRDWNPLAPFQLASAHATARVAEHTTLIAEAARTRGEGAFVAPATGSSSGTPADAGTRTQGDAERIELQHDGEALKLRAFAGRSDRGFSNASSTLNAGRSEAGLKAGWSIDERTRVLAEALHTGDLASDARRDGVLLGVERTLGEGVKAEVGLRRVDARAANGDRQDTRSVRAKLTSVLPWWPGVSTFVEAEQDVHDRSQRLLAVGGDVLLPGAARLYMRHELVSSMTGPYALDPAQRRQSTLVGIDAPAGDTGRTFGEYRARDAISGREAEAAIGLNNRWAIAEGLRLNTSLERVHPLARAEDNASAAATAAVEYTADPLWKGTARLELRDAPHGGSVLASLGLARKLDEDWTFLGRAVQAQARSGDQPDRTQQRLQLGLAWRDSGGSRIDALGRYEFKREDGLLQGATGVAGTRSVHAVSVHGNQQRAGDLVLSGVYAAKLVEETIDGQAVRGVAQRIGGRATWAMGERWDLGVSASVLGDARLRSRAVSAGAEVGWQLQRNLWVSLGHNLRGFQDKELSGSDVTRRGTYLRVRFKFDERLLAGLEG